MNSRNAGSPTAVTRAAIGRGLRFLETVLTANGAWPSRRYDNRELDGPGDLEHPPFVAGLGLLALDGCSGPAAERIRGRTRAFLHERIEYPGMWRYWPHLPPAVDDAAICSLAARPHLWLLLGRNVGTILSFRDSDGRFLTWTNPREGELPFRNETDSVVNANVVAYLTDRPETGAAQRWIEALVTDPRGRDPALRYYPCLLDLYVAVERARSLAPPVFSALGPTLADRIRSEQDPQGRFHDVMRTAQAVTALGRLGDARRRSLQPGIAVILESQRPDGGWPECLAWLGNPGTNLGFGSEALTTACCIQALHWSGLE